MTISGSGTGSRVARPLADFVRDVGLAVAEGQQELDRHSLATQLDIDRDAEVGTIPHSFEAPWYRFAEVDVDMKLHVDTELETRRGRSESKFYHPRLTVRPAEPGREDGGDHADVTSSVHFRIVPAPPNLPQKQGPDDEPSDDGSDGGR
jgi:hypothetical protein